jgi:hypothetical protein
MNEDIQKQLEKISKRAEAMRTVFEQRPGPCTGSELAALAAQISALAQLMQNLSKATA